MILLLTTISCAAAHGGMMLVVRGLLASRVTSEEDWRCRIELVVGRRYGMRTDGGEMYKG
jgi:hypothetical protein